VKILIVDDQADARDRLIRLCKRNDDIEVVVEADCGSSAIDAAGTFNPDILLLDVELPDMSHRAFGRPPQKKFAQLPIQCIAVFQLRKSERDGEIRNYLRHATGSGVMGPGRAVACMISHIMAPSLRHLWCGVCLLGALSGGSPAGAAPVATPLDTVLPGVAEPEVDLPLASDALLFASPTTRDHIGRVVVPVMVNGRGPFRFIVDTGANRSTISPRLVRELGLKPAAEASIILDGITGTAQVSFVTIDRLQAGDLTIGSTDLPVVWAPVMAGRWHLRCGRAQ
jgi:CheY-like chemotaxis protein